MKISYNWLKEYIHLTLSPEKTGDLLTQSGLEVESIEEFETIKGGLKGLVIGEVKTCEQHPNADKLKITTVDIGKDTPSPIVCGAPNVAAGQKVIVATIGTTLYPEGHEPFKIKKAKIRGEVSEGMICAEDEIGLGKSHDGIMVLETPLPNGTPASTYFDIKTDSIFEIGLTPNRADATSHFGVARDLKALTKENIVLPDVSSFSVDETASKINVEVTEKEACPRYSGITINNVKVQESPQWLKERLLSIGLSPINNIVDITNFVLHELGQPLHAFDAQKITSGKVTIKTLPEGTTFTTLDETERKLSSTDLMICDGDSPICIAGVFGGIASGVTENTTSIFLESAYFSPDWIRKTAQRHSLKTDASFRFERGTDPNMVLTALKRAALLIREIAGGVISSEIIDIYPTPIEDFEVKASVDRINTLLGFDISKQRIIEILDDLDIKLIEEKADLITLSVPPYRVDVQREADIVEEVLRIYGYDNVPLSNHLSSDYLANFPEKDPEKTILLLSNLLASNGYNEIINNSLTSSKYTDLIKEINEEENVTILNKLSEDLDVMRQTPLFSGLESLVHNINRRQKNLKFFEFGKTYHKLENKYKEQHFLSLFITGDKKEESWQQPTQKAELFDLKNVLSLISNKLNIPLTLEKDSKSYLASSATVKSGQKVLGELGKVHTKILKKMELEQDVFFLQLDFTSLHKLYSEELVHAPISKYPEVRRDLSIVLDKKVSFAEIEAEAKKAERKILKEINVFDVYEGEHIEKGKKSYSVSFTLQDFENTLTDKQIDKTMNRLIQTFEKELGALIRK